MLEMARQRARGEGSDQQNGERRKHQQQQRPECVSDTVCQFADTAFNAQQRRIDVRLLGFQRHNPLSHVVDPPMKLFKFASGDFIHHSAAMLLQEQQTSPDMVACENPRPLQNLSRQAAHQQGAMLPKR